MLRTRAREDAVWRRPSAVSAELAAELADFFAVQDEVHYIAVPLRAMVSDGLDSGGQSELNPMDLLCGEFVSTSSSAKARLEFGDYELQGVIARQAELDRLGGGNALGDGHRAEAGQRVDDLADHRGRRRGAGREADH